MEHDKRQIWHSVLKVRVLPELSSYFMVLLHSDYGDGLWEQEEVWLSLVWVVVIQKACVQSYTAHLCWSRQSAIQQLMNSWFKKCYAKE